MMVTTPSTIMPRPTCETTKPKNAFSGIFDPTVTLTVDGPFDP